MKVVFAGFHIFIYEWIIAFPVKNILKETSSQTILANFKHEGVDLTGCHYQPQPGQDEDLGSI